MIVRDRMVRGGIVSSQRLGRLSWAAQIFFHKLLHVCDDAGRFESAPAILRSALFGAVLHKVSERDVQGFLVACHEAGLVKLYTVKERGYGEVLRFGQEGLRTRRVIYPGEESDKGDVLPGFGDSDPPPREPAPPPPSPVSARLKERRKSPQPPAVAGGDVASAIEARKTARQYRSAERAKERLREVETELMDVLRPGGCPYNVQPQGEKLVRYNQLMAERKDLLNTVKPQSDDADD